MQLIETKSEGLKREFKITVPAATVAGKVEARLAEVGQTIRLPGFRPGKAPKKLLQQRYGKAVLVEVMEDSIREATGQAIKDRALRAATEPKISLVSEVKEGVDLEFTMALEILPDVPLLDYDALELERPVAEVDDAAIEEALGRLAASRRHTEPVTEDRPAQKGDTAVIDFKGTTGGEEIAGGSGTDFRLELGSNMFIPGFEDAIIGAKVGATLTIDLTFPETYHSDLAGKPATFAVDVKELRQPAQAPIDDALAQGLGLADLEALKKEIRSRLDAEYGMVARARVKRQLLDKLSEGYSFPVPEGMVQMEFDAIWQQVEQAKAKGELEPEEAAKSDDELRTEYRGLAERRVRLGLLLADVGGKNNITVTQDDLNRALMAEASRFPGQEKLVIEYYRKTDGALESLRAPLFEEKVVDFVIEKAKVTDKPVSRDELFKDLGDPDASAEASA